MRSVTLHDYQQRLGRVLAFIGTNLETALPVETLAEVAALSPYHFHRVFTGMTGERVSALVRRLRLERAASQLHETRESIIGIALDAGYDSHEAFSRAFHKAFGVSPSRFRREASRSPHLPARSGIHLHPEAGYLRFNPTPLRAMPIPVSIKRLPGFHLACLRHVGPYDECGETWGRIGELLVATAETEPGAQMVGICYDDPENTPPVEIRYDAGMTVPADFQVHDGLTLRQIAGGEFAVATHQGPYSRLQETYHHLHGEWLPRSGRELADAPCFEIYINDPDSTDPEDLHTDIYAPLKS